MRFSGFCLLTLLFFSSAAIAEDSPTRLTVANHHPFTLREPVSFQLPAGFTESDRLLAISQSVSGGTVEAHYLPVQIDENQSASIDVQLRAGESRTYTFQKSTGSASTGSKIKISESGPGNLPKSIIINKLPEIVLGEITFLKSTPKTEITENISSEIGQNRLKADFQLLREIHGPVKSSLLFSGDIETGSHSIPVSLLYEIYPSGLIDLSISLTPPTEILLSRSFSNASHTTLQTSDGKIIDLSSTKISPNNPAWFLINRDDDDEQKSAAWLIKPTRLPHLLLKSENNLTELTWLSAARTADLRFRLLPQNRTSTESIDEAFAAYAGFQSLRQNGNESIAGFGTDSTVFGFNYSPETAFGKSWQNSTAEIERDLRIANAIGFEWIRLTGLRNFSEKDLTLLSGLAHNAGLKLYLDLSKNHNSLTTDLLKTTGFDGFIQLPENLSESDAKSLAEQITEIKKTNPNIRFASQISSNSLSNLEQSDAELDGAFYKIPSEIPNRQAGHLGILFSGLAATDGKTPIASFDSPSSIGKSDDEEANHLYHRLNSLLQNGSATLLLQGPLTPAADGSGFSLLHLDRTPKTQALALRSLITKYDRDNPAKPVEIKLHQARIRPGQDAKIPVSVTNTTREEIEIELIPHLPEGMTAGKSEPITLRPRETITYDRVISAAETLKPGFHHYFEEVRTGDIRQFGWSYLAFRSRPAFDDTKPPAAGVTYIDGIETIAENNLSTIRQVVFGTGSTETELLAARLLQEKLRQTTGAPIQRIAQDRLDSGSPVQSLLLIGTPTDNPLIEQYLPEIKTRLEETPSLILTHPHPANPNRFLLIITGKEPAHVTKALTDFTNRLTIK